VKVGQAGIDLIKEFEGCRLVAYLDSVDVPTIGYGHTRGVKIGDVCTAEQADAWLLEDLKDAEACVNGAVTVPLTQPEFDACVSLVFNIGCGNFRRSTLLRKLLDSDYDGCSLEFARWNKAGGKVLAGLTRRREAERELFEKA
jgi:lysozyme